MALRYRNEQVINSLRTAYSLTHRDDSLLLNDEGRTASLPPEAGELEAYLTSLTLKVHLDAASDMRSRSSQVTSRSDSFGIISNGQRNTSVSDYDADDSTDQIAKLGHISAQHMNRSSSEHFGTPIAVAAVPPPSIVPPTAVAQPLTMFLASEANGEANGEVTGEVTGEDTPILNKTADDPPDGSTTPVEPLHNHSFPKDFGLDMDDESDFDDDLLRATQEIKHNRNTIIARPKARADSRVSQRSANAGSRNHSAFDEPDAFTKREDFMSSNQQPSNSQLTSQLTATQRDPREQYLEATTGLKSGQSAGFGLTMHLKGKSPLNIVVKNDCTAHLAIGFALLTANADLGDANMYNLRLAEDDGEPDEDFPALDRTRPIASYHVDEFALVKATEVEFRDNSKRTPNKVSFKSKSPPASSRPDRQPASGNQSRNSPQPLESNNSLTQQKPLPYIGMSGIPGGFPARNTNMNYNTTTGSGVPSAAFSSLQRPSGQEKPGNHSEFRAKPFTVPDKTESRTSVQYATSFGDSRNDFVVVKVYMHPYDPILSRPFWADEMIQKQTKVSEVFEQMCREKLMDAEMYVLRLTEKSSSHSPPSPQSPKAQAQASAPAQSKASQPKVLNMNAAVQTFVSKPAPRNFLAASSVGPGISSVGGGAEEETPSVIFELVPRRQLQGGQNSVRRSTSQTMHNHESSPPDKAGSSSSNGKKKPSNDLQNAVLAMQPLGFYKYPVARRQQMNFLARSERELVIDGEYVHIMPPTDWSLLDQPKTTTFHIRQILRVKQSRKVPTNFSIVIMKATGPKRYDLESKDASTAAEIVDQLQRLKQANLKPII